MSRRKSSTLTVCIAPALKEALSAAAAGEHRSIVNMVEVLTWDWWDRNGIAIPEQDALFNEDRQPPSAAPATNRGTKP
ncbi:hypothetical protein MAMT_02159 [Methylacidimicrobium tartarophylax]|uniref:CopG-like ribbon-helix-helix domain-containing protein n=2 Tax=Methylacidimicrobium tartarophylax TaxID=1041768 RepID=A0A5E6MQ23_9BACT|nr:hypothetical protein [Methylacidimicrobium tartarophylax]VVM08169.1 hypothetical protein MAMT_02159 [Methylacidimicrobium tartarophylax]